MPRGKVKFFNNDYGFIIPDDGGEEVFVHYSVIQEDGYRKLKKDQVVEYEAKRGDKGMQATKVVKV